MHLILHESIFYDGRNLFKSPTPLKPLLSVVGFSNPERDAINRIAVNINQRENCFARVDFCCVKEHLSGITVIIIKIHSNGPPVRKFSTKRSQNVPPFQLREPPQPPLSKKTGELLQKLAHAHSCTG